LWRNRVWLRLEAAPFPSLQAPECQPEKCPAEIGFRKIKDSRREKKESEQLEPERRVEVGREEAG